MCEEQRMVLCLRTKRTKCKDMYMSLRRMNRTCNKEMKKQRRTCLQKRKQMGKEMWEEAGNEGMKDG